MDVHPSEDGIESFVGDIADLDTCRRAVEGMDVVVLCHMAPNPTGYATPVQAIDVNVKGTANLYFAAHEREITRFVLISSTGVLPEPAAVPTPGDGPYNYHYSLYVLTKIMQEATARFYHEMHGINTAILRPSWVVYDEDFTTKYGQKMDHYEPGLIDPRDIGAAVDAALALPDPGLEVFQIGQDDSGLDVTAAQARLGWTPRYRFTSLPRTAG
jgi:nucleoside-diphosphate-sugar epimerase